LLAYSNYKGRTFEMKVLKGLMGLSCPQGVFYLSDGFGHMDIPRAGFGAVEGGPAAPDAILFV
jgi:hypothetical protein